MTYIIFVIDAAKLSSIKESQMEDAIRKWVKYACDRDGGRKRRAEKQKCKLLDDIAPGILLAFLSFANRKGPTLS